VSKEAIMGEMEGENGVSAGYRNPTVALLLSVCPGLGQQYAGHLVRGIVLYVALIVVSWLAAIAFMYIDSRVSIVFLAVPFVGVALIALDAWRLARKQPADYQLKWFNRPVVYAGVFLFLLFTVNPLMDMLVGANIVRAFPVTSSSMAPTVLKNDLLVINKLSEPGRGDVVLIDFRGEGASSRFSDVIDIELFRRIVHSLFGKDEIAYKDGQLVRRLIALPGDTVEIKDGKVAVNGTRLEEPYLMRDIPAHGEDPVEQPFTDDFGPETVPEGMVFVLGDNRGFSIDSRVLGPIPRKQVVGKVTKVFWSWNFDDHQIHWERTALPVK